MTSLLFLLLAQTADPAETLNVLESKARAVRTIHAELECTRLPGLATLVVNLDLENQNALFILSRDGKSPSEFRLLQDWKRYQWRPDEPGVMTDCRLYGQWPLKEFNDVLAALPPPPGGAAPAGSEPYWRVGLGLNLERKPSKDEFGEFNFYSSVDTTPFRWLGLLRDEKNVRLAADGNRWVFRIPERQKTVVLDRESGFLHSIETVDYDGTRRSILCRKATLNDKLPPFPAPPKCREVPISRKELENHIGGRRQLLDDMLGVLAGRWTQVRSAGRTASVAEAYAREIAALSALWWEVRLHQVAAALIQQRLDLGTPHQTLEQEADRDIDAFAEQARRQSEEDRAFLEKCFKDHAKRLEQLYRERGPKDTDPDAFVKPLGSAVNLDAIWADLLKTTARRAGEVYRTELRNARQL